MAYYMPPNTIENQFLGLDCCKFSSLNFDESLTGGRITRTEVDELINNLNAEAGLGCRKPMCYIITFIITLAVIITVYIMALIHANGVNIGLIIGIYLVALLTTIVLFILSLVKLQRGQQKKGRAFLEIQNKNVYHQRNMHWMCSNGNGHQQQPYLQLMLNFNPNQFQQPQMVPIVVQQQQQQQFHQAQPYVQQQEPAKLPVPDHIQQQLQQFPQNNQVYVPPQTRNMDGSNVQGQPLIRK